MPPCSEAVSLPRVHEQLLPQPDVYAEYYSWGKVDIRVSNSSQAFLQGLGDNIKAMPGSLGVSQAIVVDADGRAVHGMGDARKDGAAMGH